MVKKIGKEIGIFLLVLFVMAIGMHQAELPERIGIAADDPAVLSHSFMWASLGYVAVLVLRLLFAGVKKLFFKKPESME